MMANVACFFSRTPLRVCRLVLYDVSDVYESADGRDVLLPEIDA